MKSKSVNRKARSKDNEEAEPRLGGLDRRLRSSDLRFSFGDGLRLGPDHQHGAVTIGDLTRERGVAQPLLGLEELLIGNLLAAVERRQAIEHRLGQFFG